MYMEEAIRRIPDVDPSTVSTTVVARAGAIPLRSDVSPAATAASAADAQGVGVARGAHSADVGPSTVSTAVVARAGAIPLRSDVSPAATAAGAAAAQGVVVARGAHSATAVQVVDSRDASPRMSVPSASATCTATVSDDRHGWQGPTQTAAGTATAQGVGVAREGNPPMRGGSQRYSACKQNECQLPCRSC
jgi:hypothetical protein